MNKIIKIGSLIALLLVLSQFSFAQNNSDLLFGIRLDPSPFRTGLPSNASKYKFWLQPMHGLGNAREVLLVELQPTSIIAIPSVIYGKLFPKTNKDYQSFEYDVHKIRSIIVRKKGRITLGALIGTAAGAGVGLLLSRNITASRFDLLTPFVKGVFITTGLASLGGIVGGLIGSVRVTIPIKGSPRNYKFKKEQIEQYMILKEH